MRLIYLFVNESATHTHTHTSARAEFTNVRSCAGIRAGVKSVFITRKL